MSTHNIGFYEDLTKIIFELSSNTHLISSAGISQTLEFFGIETREIILSCTPDREIQFYTLSEKFLYPPSYLTLGPHLIIIGCIGRHVTLLVKGVTTTSKLCHSVSFL